MHHPRVMFNYIDRYADLESKLWTHLGDEVRGSVDIA